MFPSSLSFSLGSSAGLSVGPLMITRWEALCAVVASFRIVGWCL
jgi:hypothetical protein